MTKMLAGLSYAVIACKENKTFAKILRKKQTAKKTAKNSDTTKRHLLAGAGSWAPKCFTLPLRHL